MKKLPGIKKLPTLTLKIAVATKTVDTEPEVKMKKLPGKKKPPTLTLEVAGQKKATASTAKKNV